MAKPKTTLLKSTSSCGEIYETSIFQDGLYFLKKQFSNNKKCLALFDIDNTILSYRHSLGTDQWFDFDYHEFIKKGHNNQEALSLTLNQYIKILEKIHEDDVYTVEESTPIIIQEIQKSGIDCLALTARGTSLLETTKSQLAKFQINFNQGAFSEKTKPLPPKPNAGFIDGLILTDGQNKGDCLISCIQDGPLPDFIIMWEDKLANLEKVRNSIDEFNQKNNTSITFVGIRYSRLDQQAKNVDPNIIALQKSYYDRILSDEHAQAILKAQEKEKKPIYADIDFQTKKNRVRVSICKPILYKLLKEFDPKIKARSTNKNKVISFHNKPKLAWQFDYSIHDFEPIFHKLSQHGYIHPLKFNSLSAIFNPPSPTYLNLYQLASSSASPQENTQPHDHHHAKRLDYAS